MGRTNVRGTQIRDDSIENVDIASDAAIAGSKVDPDFGSQDVTTTGDVTSNNMFLGVVAGDPSSPIEGQIWYNSTDNQFKGRNDTEIIILG